jgi:hypothetical protein
MREYSGYGISDLTKAEDLGTDFYMSFFPAASLLRELSGPSPSLISTTKHSRAGGMEGLLSTESC